MRLFAGLREAAGRDELELELPDGARVADALAQVQHLAPGTSLVLAVNREYAARDVVLAEGDELAVVPPVSGGEVVEGELSLDAVAARVADPRAGAVVTFSGVTRDVEFLDYEAYAEMAGAKIDAIVAEAIERHGLCRAAADHRFGRVPLGEASVVVAASAPHRPEAFAGAREIIDRIKAEAPIWKREEGAWVEGTVPTEAPAPASRRAAGRGSARRRSAARRPGPRRLRRRAPGARRARPGRLRLRRGGRARRLARRALPPAALRGAVPGGGRGAARSSRSGACATTSCSARPRSWTRTPPATVRPTTRSSASSRWSAATSRARTRRSRRRRWTPRPRRWSSATATRAPSRRATPS